MNAHRIVIVGSTCSGKTTLGRQLSQALSIPWTDLDDLYWLPNWTPRSFEEFSEKVAQVAAQERFIICGNQSKVRPLFWKRADTIIWLDLPFSTILWRLIKRGLGQFRSKEHICNGNTQSFSQFIWLIKWAFTSFRKRRRTYTELKAQSPHLQWIHLKTKQEADTFLSGNGFADLLSQEKRGDDEKGDCRS